MCPSYRVTRDEQHLTRGRANTLRLALSGQLGDDAFVGEEVREALDLCVSCKGCKRDCPTGVDMAKMKIEFTAHYKKQHGHTWRDKLVAHLPDYAHRASRLPWLLNLRDALPGAAWVSEKLLGLSARRSLPRWRADTFWRGQLESTLFATQADTLAAAAAGQLVAVLFVDTFNGTFDSENAWAAARVLKAGGFTVHAVQKAGGHYCCGPHLPGHRHGGAGARQGGSVGGRLAAIRASGHRHRGSGTLLPADLARRGAGDGPGR